MNEKADKKEVNIRENEDGNSRIKKSKVKPNPATIQLASKRIEKTDYISLTKKEEIKLDEGNF